VTHYSRGRYLVLVNKNDAHARRRWTLAHELKHLLDYTKSKAMYEQLGYGDETRREQCIERICDHYAASLLMPRMWVKHAYGNRIQDITALAGLFNVPEEAMHIRLKFLGIIDDEPERITRTYFRRTGWLREWGPAVEVVATRSTSTWCRSPYQSGPTWGLEPRTKVSRAIVRSLPDGPRYCRLPGVLRTVTANWYVY
jgi:hypothetical protein